MIGIEQRMVRAEVVFLGGGEVEDELEEAAKSDELTEGRLQNTGRAEMLRAINAMSRAEAQLNDGRAAEALVFERQALASLERALDRRRYFLRTLPDRSRIDADAAADRRAARRAVVDARSTTVPAATLARGARRVMRELAAASAMAPASTPRWRRESPPSIRLRRAFRRPPSRSRRRRPTRRGAIAARTRDAGVDGACAQERPRVDRR